MRLARFAAPTSCSVCPWQGRQPRASAADGGLPGGVLSDAPRSVHVAASAAGLGCVHTVSVGDCGPDTMCLLLGWSALSHTAGKCVQL